MATVSLAMIVKNESDIIERVLACAKPLCDEMIVVDTGSIDDTVAKATAMGATVHHFKWIDDFAAARNFSFSKCNKDWILWLDADDVITPENQKRILELKNNVLSDELDAVFLRYIYPPFVQWRERMVRRELFGKSLEWRAPIHECLHGIDPGRTRYFEDISIQHETPPDRHLVKQDRNIRILRKSYEKGDRDERTLYIYAVECLHNLYKEEGEEVFATFFANAQYSPYKYEILTKMHPFYMHFNDPEKAVEALNKAIVEDPRRAEAYYLLGKHMLDKNDDPNGALPLLQTASIIALPDYGTPEMAAYTYGPWEALCHAHFHLEDYSQAQEMARMALEYNSPNRDWLTKLAEYDIRKSPPEPLPDAWQEWLEGNIFNNAQPHHVMIRILEENQFSPGQIITGLQVVTAKKRSGRAVGNNFTPEQPDLGK